MFWILSPGEIRQRRSGSLSKGRLELGVAGAGSRYCGAALGRHFMREGVEAQIGMLVGDGRLK